MSTLQTWSVFGPAGPHRNALARLPTRQADHSTPVFTLPVQANQALNYNRKVEYILHFQYSFLLIRIKVATKEHMAFITPPSRSKPLNCQKNSFLEGRYIH